MLAALLAARSPRLSELSRALPGNPVANYKRRQRFLAKTTATEALLPLCWEEAPCVSGAPTEVPQPGA